MINYVNARPQAVVSIGLALLVSLFCAAILPAQTLDEELLRDLPAASPKLPQTVPRGSSPAPRGENEGLSPTSPTTKSPTPGAPTPAAATPALPPPVPMTSPSGLPTPTVGPFSPRSPPSPQSPRTQRAPDAVTMGDGSLSSADVEGEDVGETPVESLHRALGRMADAARRLSAGDTSTATRGLQTEALAALDTVIARESERQRRGGLGRRPSAGGKGGKEGGKEGQKTAGEQSAGDRSSDDQAGGGRDESTEEGRSEGSGQGGQEGQDGAAGGTAGGTGAADGRRAREPMESRAAVMDTEAWGQLPPQLRERLRNSLPERFLPGFETMLESYYRRLAEMPKTQGEGRP